MNTNEWIEKQKTRLSLNSESYGALGCLLCKLGGGKAPYSKLTVTYPWNKQKKTMYSHRYAFMLHTNNFELPLNMQVSHICHNKRCVNAEHLSLEPEHVNKDRQICRGLYPVHCKTHLPYPDCML